jgi:hypothetical protein
VNPAGTGFKWAYNSALTSCYYIIHEDGSVGAFVSSVLSATGDAECTDRCFDENCEPIYEERKVSLGIVTGEADSDGSNTCDPDDDGSGSGGDVTWGLYCDVTYEFNWTTLQYDFWVDWLSCVWKEE